MSGPRIHSDDWAQALVGKTVRVTGNRRWNGREGTLVRLVTVAAGGYDKTRTAVQVDLTATARAAARRVTVYPSSIEPAQRP